MPSCLFLHLISSYITYLCFLDEVQLCCQSAVHGSPTSNSTWRHTNRSRALPSLPSPLSMPLHNNAIKMNVPSIIALLSIAVALVFITAKNLVESLEGMIREHPSIPKGWITLILIPAISNAAATAVIVPRMGNVELAMGAAVGSCINIAFLVIPFLVLIAWALDKPLILLFNPLETVVSCPFETHCVGTLLISFSSLDPLLLQYDSGSQIDMWAQPHMTVLSAYAAQPV